MLLGVVHTAALVGGITLATAVAFVVAAAVDSSWGWLAFLLVAAGLGTLLTTLVFTLYLIIASLLGRNQNELFIGIRWSGYKNFLRLRIDAEGSLHVHAVGVRTVDKRELTWDAEGSPRVSGAASTPTLIDSLIVPRSPDGA